MGLQTPLRKLDGAMPLEGDPLKVDSPRILLVVGGGIAAYKSCELVRLIRKGGGNVTCVVTEGGQQFVTPMALAALSENRVYTSLFDLKDEAEMGHIQLSREADLVVICPATADLIAKMAAGIADDLATTMILATDKPVTVVPAMNVRMWQHQATQRNVEWLAEAGVTVLDPDEGPMACGEFGPGRLPEPAAIWMAIAEQLGIEHGLDDPPRPRAVGAAELTVDDLAGEALEPEEGFDEGPEDEAAGEEDEPRAKGGLGGLLASIIPRNTGRRAPDFDDEFIEAARALDPDAEQPAEEGEPIEETDSEAPEPMEVEQAEEEISAEPDLSNPLFAKKGSAASAPPTDPEALNHLVKTGAGKQKPETVAFDAGDPASARQFADLPADTMAAAVALDPLAGQMEFDPDPDHRPLFGKHVLVTAGPTWEPIDPVRYIANRSSGRQGFSIAAMAAAAGARVTLIAGPVSLPTPLGVDRIDVESADEMAAEVKKALPAEVAFMVAAVADWRPKDVAAEKMKKRGSAPPALILTENPDILTTVAAAKKRPKLLIGFAAETQDVIDNAKGKRKRKGADWIVANDVSTDVMGGLRNTVHLVTSGEVESFDEMPKEDVARELVARAAMALNPEEGDYADD